MAKAHQKVIREQKARIVDEEDASKREAASSFDNAFVKEISRQEAGKIILEYEWLGTMGTAELAIGLYFKHPKTGAEYLAGVACFGSTMGSETLKAVFGKEHAHKGIVLVRGACVHWADRPVKANGKVHSGAAASYLITRACKLLTVPCAECVAKTCTNPLHVVTKTSGNKVRTRYKRAKAYNFFVAYSDSEAGEIGTVYQACGWLYCGTSSATERFYWPVNNFVPFDYTWPEEWLDGKKRDCKSIHSATRKRTERPEMRKARAQGQTHYKGERICGSYLYIYRQADDQPGKLKAEMKAAGFEFIDGNPKGRYVGIYGNRGAVKGLRRSLKWESMPYPKRFADGQ